MSHFPNPRALDDSTWTTDDRPISTSSNTATLGWLPDENDGISESMIESSLSFVHHPRTESRHEPLYTARVAQSRALKREDLIPVAHRKS